MSSKDCTFDSDAVAMELSMCENIIRHIATSMIYEPSSEVLSSSTLDAQVCIVDSKHVIDFEVTDEHLPK